MLAGRGELPKSASAVFTNSDHTIYFSIASIWELGIKAALKKIELKQNLVRYSEVLLDQGLESLPIEIAHIEKAVGLPRHHKDPFDRLLVGQALVEGLTVLGNDAIFEKYGCRLLWN